MLGAEGSRIGFLESLCSQAASLSGPVPLPLPVPVPSVFIRCSSLVLLKALLLMKLKFVEFSHPTLDHRTNFSVLLP